MTPYNYRELQRKIRRKVRTFKRVLKTFWKEWGMTLEEFEMFLGACGVFMFPLLLRIFLAFFGI